MSKIMFCNKIVLPEPEGPITTLLKGILGAIEYLDWVTVYSFNFIGNILGVLLFSVILYMCDNKITLDEVLLSVLQVTLGVTLATIIQKLAEFISECIKKHYEEDEEEQPVIWRGERSTLPNDEQG